MNFFTEKGFEIEEGSPVTEGGKYAAVIHRWLAEENDLQIGDTILLSLNEQMVSDDVMTGEGIAGKSAQVEIKGIFESTEPQEDEVLLSHVLYENTIFIDVQSYCELFPEGGDAYFESADFQVDDPEKLDALIQQIRELEGSFLDQCTFTKHAVDYENARKSLEALEQTEDPVELTQIQVGVNGQDILFVYGAGTVLIIFSVTAAGIPVLRLKPKEILTKMN